MVINRLKPDASRRTRVVLAALLWTCIGLMLMFRGGYPLIGSGQEWVLAAALLLGTIKSRLVLDRVAARNMHRILAQGDYSCLGGVYSWKTWLLIIAMIVMGRLLRASGLPSWLTGALYVTVGWGLFWSSRRVWTEIFRGAGRSGAGDEAEIDEDGQ